MPTVHGFALTLASVAPPQSAPTPPPPVEYAIVVSRDTAAAWPRAVAALQAKHAAAVVMWHESVHESHAELAARHPRFVCFLARPAEAGRDYVIAASRLTRRLDDDPYGDCLWGIVTGHDESDPMRIAGRAGPLLVRRGAGGTEVPLELFHEGAWWGECEQGLSWQKAPGGEPEKKACAPDTTAAIVAELNRDGHWFVTSGHATENDWQIGFNFRNGQLRCRDGRLFGVDLDGMRHEVRAAGPRVYSAAGNCRMGHIVDRHSMALGWIHSAGVDQMIGYVVSTWCGQGGWGTNHYFYMGLHGFAESFFLNNQWLVYQLESRFEDAARVDFDRWDIEKNPALVEQMMRDHGVADRDAAGLLWDRDTVAFYGDPAWIARLDRQAPLPFEQSLAEKDGVWTFAVRTIGDGEWTRPPATMLPRRLRDPERIAGTGLVTDDFVMLATTGSFVAGQRWAVEFRDRGK